MNPLHQRFVRHPINILKRVYRVNSAESRGLVFPLLAAMLSVLLPTLISIPLSGGARPFLPQPPTGDPSVTQEQKKDMETLQKQAKKSNDEHDYPATLKQFQAMLDKARSLKSASFTARALTGLSMVYYAMEQYDKALVSDDQALGIRKTLSDSLGVAESMNNLGNDNYRLGRFDTALGLFNDSLTILKTQNVPQRVAARLSNVGNVYADMGQFDKALESYNSAVEIFKNLGDPHDIAPSLNNLGIFYAELGQFTRAFDCDSQALALFKKLGDPQSIAESLQSVGSVHYSMGEFDKAIDTYNSALEIFKKLGDRQNTAASLINLGLVYEDLGQYNRALELDRQALEAFKIVGNPQSIGSGLSSVGNVYADLRQYEKSLDYGSQALVLARKLKNEQAIATNLNNLGTIYFSMRKFDQARDFFTQALELRKKLDNPQNLAYSLQSLGSVYSAQNQFDRALDMENQALEQLRKLPNQQDIAAVLSNVGGTYRNLGRFDEAERAFAESRTLRERLTYQVGDPSQIGALQETFEQFYERYAQLLVERERPENALEILEAGRGQGLARQIDLNERGDLKRLFTEQERELLKGKTDRLNLTLTRLRNAEQFSEGAPEALHRAAEKQVDAARDEEVLAEQEYNLYRDALFARYPEMRDVAENRPAHFARLLALARDHPDTLYLEYALADDSDGKSLLFALGQQDGLKCLPLATGAEPLRALANKWRETIEVQGGRGVDRANGPHQDRLNVPEKTLAAQAYQILLGPAEKAGLLAANRYKRLVFVGSGPMLEVPLAALVDSTGKRLMERYPISHTISLSVLLWRTSPFASKSSLLSIADPTGAAMRTIASHAPATATGPRASSGHGKPSSLFRTGFAPLPGARTEGIAVAELFPGARLLVGPGANESTVTRLLPYFNIIHFATHAFVVPKAVLSSGLVLAEDRADVKSDGLLTARKIMNLPLSARLAVLSACETGRGSAAGGEGLMGLAWAFRAAGCPSLVVSQWQVNDAVTEDWMMAFYRAIKAGKTKDEALQTAMRAVQTTRPTPYYWAAFELIGDAGPLLATKATHTN